LITRCARRNPTNSVPGLEAKVHGRGGQWCLSLEDSCSHAVDVERRDGRVFVLFVADKF
jgi:hypothetical protein